MTQSFPIVPLFSTGTIIPVFPYIFFSGITGIIASAASSVFGLFGIGAAITLMTGVIPLSPDYARVLLAWPPLQSHSGSDESSGSI